jgi:hypothetical protein
MEGTDPEEREVQDGGGCYCPNREKNWHGKNVAVYSPIVGLRYI